MDEEQAILREAIRATRAQLRTSDRSLRLLRQFLADLEERLNQTLDAKPEEAQRNGSRSSTEIFAVK
jgi:septal ring factor EnvC (AmiA/AmiB activator)